MALNIFKKNKKAESDVNQDSYNEEKDTDKNTEKEESLKPSRSLLEKMGSVPNAYKVLKNFYVSEKATMLVNVNQYVFKVFKDANKAEIKKNVEKAFNVKVKSVKILNAPKKTRNVGKYSGYKTGFKKAIIVLEKGYAIEEAKA